jgi:cytochrome c6
LVKEILKVAAIFCCAAFLVTPAFAQDSGADIFKLRCAMCHGADGMAQTPAGKIFKAASFSDPAIIKTPDSERATIIKTGKNKMPSFAGKLTDDEIKSVLAYIRTLQK